MLLVVFLTAATALWLSIFGYLGLLVVLAFRRDAPWRRDLDATADELPTVAVVVPVRNEAALIAGKLDDLRRTDYPRERLAVVIADGGSTDATRAALDAARSGGMRFEVVEVPHARRKVDQLNAVLPRLHQEVVVCTDADATLEPGCIGALVATLRADPQTSVVGARVRPATRLLEERIHWRLLNRLWWLEGEALGAAAVSGVCFAMRRAETAPLPGDCDAEDVHVALRATAHGRRARLCRTALATELRVPQSAREFLRFRRRRGAGYLRELRRPAMPGVPARWHVVRGLRLFHFLAMPALAGLAAGSAVLLLATPAWPWVPATAGTFAVPLLAAGAASSALPRLWHVPVAAGRLAGLIWLSLLAITPRTDPSLVRGDRPC